PTAPSCICTLSLHDALPISLQFVRRRSQRLSESVASALGKTGGKLARLDYLRGMEIYDHPTFRMACQQFDLVADHLAMSQSEREDRKSTRLNSSHQIISYAV